MNNLKVGVGIIALCFFSCNQHYVKSIYPIPSKELFKRQLHYKDKYAYINSSADTIIHDKSLCKVYRKGILIEIGKMHDNKPTGYWFIFKDSLELEYILNYKTHGTDSFYHPFSLVHQSW